MLSMLSENNSLPLLFCVELALTALLANCFSALCVFLQWPSQVVLTLPAFIVNFYRLYVFSCNGRRRWQCF